MAHPNAHDYRCCRTQNWLIKLADSMAAIWTGGRLEALKQTQIKKKLKEYFFSSLGIK